MPEAFLGFDTSNYTTSVCALEGEQVHSIRSLLAVKEGQRGLRQSDALFQHVKQLPLLYEELGEKAGLRQVRAVGVSTRPRSVAGSYMPVFLAGEGYARVAAQTLGIPLYSFSHQDGHLMAGIYSADAWKLLDAPFLSVHISGGTTEILKTEYDGSGFVNEIIGGTKDISAGQLIDRIGVKLGIAFPCGKELEALASDAGGTVKLPLSVDKGYFNFSGAETKALGFAETEEPGKLAAGVFELVGDTLARAVADCVKQTGVKQVLLVGGVASNGIIRKRMMGRCGAETFFASPELSTDNAVGIALCARKKAENGE